MVDDADTVEDAVNAVVFDHKRREVDRQSNNNKHRANAAYTIGWSVDLQVDPRKGHRSAEKLQRAEEWTKGSNEVNVQEISVKQPSICARLQRQLVRSEFRPNYLADLIIIFSRFQRTMKMVQMMTNSKTVVKTIITIPKGLL